MKNIKNMSEFISENIEGTIDPQTQALRSKIEKAIRETLVIENSQSVKYAVNRIISIINDEIKNVAPPVDVVGDSNSE
jgi:hypothetical protein